MAGRRRGRTGRGWDAAPPRARSASRDEASRGEASRSDAFPDEAGREEHGPGSAETESGGGWGTSGRGSGGDRRGGGPGGGRWGRAASAADAAVVEPGERAREICLRLLAVRPRTRAELAGALHQRGIPADVTKEVLERYSEVGIIDDKAFARAWVSSRHHGRGLAGRALANELRQKGVDADSVGAALADLDPETEAATARALVDRKLRTDKGGPSEAVMRRLVGMLARKGYAPGLAVSVVKQALAERAEAHAEAEAAPDGDVDLDLATDALVTELLEAEAED